ncbi:porin [soil metagenome]
MTTINSTTGRGTAARTIRHLALVTTASLVTFTAASAADLPAKAKAVQYVKVCSLYGAGYYYMPGTDTCIKLSGYVRADANFLGGNYDKPGWDQGNAEGTKSRDRDNFTTRVRTELQIDTRTTTEYGVLRTYMNPRFQFDTGAAPDTGVITLDYGFVQFAGFTLGKAVSTFQTPWGSTGANSSSSYFLGGYDNINGITQLAYTWQFGNGISAQLGVEDTRVINRAQLLNAGATYSPTLAFNSVGATVAASSTTAVAALSQGVWTNSYGGNVAPDLVGNVRIDQKSFTFQVSGALHTVNANYYANGNPAAPSSVLETSGHPDVKLGGAVLAGFQLKNLPTGPGDKLSVDATWSKGATKYVISGVTGNNFDIFGGGSPLPGSYQTFAVAQMFDAVYGTGSQLELTTAWGVRAAFVHNWSPQWETGVFASYSKIDYNTNAATGICAAQARAVAGLVSTAGVAASQGNGYSCNPDFAIFQIGTRTGWTPVKNLTFSAEVLYSRLDQNYTGSLLNVPAQVMGAFKPAGSYDYKDQGVISGNIGVRRTF